MASSSFYRRAVVSSSLALRTPHTPLRVSSTRPFSISTSNRTMNDDEHAAKKPSKGQDLDVQSANAKAGMDSAKKSGTGGHATEGKDSAGGVAKAKKEHPEAPDPAIGMQDERGGRGA